MTAYYPLFDDDLKEGPPGMPGIGFKLTNDGNYDMEDKILKNCKNPEDDNDSSTKKYVDDIKKKCLIRNNGYFDAKRKLIRNLEDPREEADASTKRYVDEELLAMKENMRRNIEMSDESFKNYTVATASKIQSLEMDLTRSVDRLMKQYTPSTYACAAPPDNGYSNKTFQRVSFDSFSNDLLNGPLMSFSENAKVKVTFFALLEKEGNVPLVARIWNANKVLKNIDYQGGQVAFITPIVKDKEIKVNVKTDDPKAEIYLKVEILQCSM